MWWSRGRGMARYWNQTSNLQFLEDTINHCAQQPCLSQWMSVWIESTAGQGHLYCWYTAEGLSSNSSTSLIDFNSHLFDGFHYSKNMQKSVESEEKNVEGCSTLIMLFKVILWALLLVVNPTPSFHQNGASSVIRARKVSEYFTATLLT